MVVGAVEVWRRALAAVVAACGEICGKGVIAVEGSAVASGRRKGRGRTKRPRWAAAALCGKCGREVDTARGSGAGGHGSDLGELDAEARIGQEGMADLLDAVDDGGVIAVS